MVIQLKNVRVNEGLSRESLAFSATLYINGQRVGLISNDGNGGETHYQSFDNRGAALIEEAVKWVGSFSRKPGASQTDGAEAAADAEKFRDHLEETANCWWNGKELAKFQRQAEKAMVKGIVFGVPGKAYRVMQYTQPIAVIIGIKKGVERLRQDIHLKVIPMLSGDEKILNTNIPMSVVGLLEVPVEKWISR